MKEDETKRTLSLLGLCKKAGRLTVGTPLVCDAMREGKILLALYAAQAAENSVKRVCDKARSTDTRVLAVDCDAETLGHAVGKTGAVAAVGTADAGFAKALLKILGETPSSYKV